MNNFQLELSGIHLARLMAGIDTMNKELSIARGNSDLQGPQAPLDAIEAAWLHVAAMLEVKAEPKRRECPTCHHMCMQEASRCGYCWHPLPALEKVEGRA